MSPRRRRQAAVLGVATFVAVLALSVAATPDAAVEAEAPVAAGALAGVGKMNADANAAAARRAQRVRREGSSAL